MISNLLTMIRFIIGEYFLIRLRAREREKCLYKLRFEKHQGNRQCHLINQCRLDRRMREREREASRVVFFRQGMINAEMSKNFLTVVFLLSRVVSKQ